MSDPADETAGIIDFLASEYGWTVDQIMEIPIDQIAQIMHAILHRRGVRTFRKNLMKDSNTPSLADRLKDIFGKVDTATS